MTIKSINDAVSVVYDMGYTKVNYLSTCVTCVKNDRGIHLVVSLEDEDQFFPVTMENAELDYDAEGTIAFNGVSFEEWKSLT